jgi:GNAT superfamily N-acetyltransferase
LLLRLLTNDDVPQAFELSSKAGWNQTAEDWRRLLHMAPEGCWAIEEDGLVVSTATLVSYGELGWLGMVLTREAYRRRGYARLLLERALERRPPTVKLDATDAGRPLYVSFGFVDEEPVERWRKPAGPVAAIGCEPGRPDGYAQSRPGRLARYLGPCAAADAESAEALIRAVLAQHPEEPWFWDLLPANRAAAMLATRLGFAPVRRLMRMRLGPPCKREDAVVYAIAGFELG